jgi:hypothetical protein
MTQMPRNHAPHTSVYVSERNHESLKAIYYITRHRNKLLRALEHVYDSES